MTQVYTANQGTESQRADQPFTSHNAHLEVSIPVRNRIEDWQNSGPSLVQVDYPFTMPVARQPLLTIGTEEDYLPWRSARNTVSLQIAGDSLQNAEQGMRQPLRLLRVTSGAFLVLIATLALVSTLFARPNVGAPLELADAASSVRPASAFRDYQALLHTVWGTVDKGADDASLLSLGASQR